MTIWGLMNDSNFLTTGVFFVAGVMVVLGMVYLINKIKREKRINNYLKEIEKRAKKAWQSLFSLL